MYLHHLRAQKCVRSNSKLIKQAQWVSKVAPQPQLFTPGITKGAPVFQAEKGVWRRNGKALEGRCKEEKGMTLRAEWQGVSLSSVIPLSNPLSPPEAWETG